MTKKDKEIIVDYYKRRIKEDPEGKREYMAEIRRIKK